MQPRTSPRILNLSWGRMEIDGVGAGKDFKLWPGGGREWNNSRRGASPPARTTP